MRRAPGTRVRVFAGDGKTPLGEGTYVGEATVYYVVDAQGTLLSEHDAEDRPDLTDHSKFPPGAEIEESRGNPKIVLDKPMANGRTIIYGCQCWWEPIGPAPRSTPEPSAN